MRFGLFVPFHRLDPSEPVAQVYADALEQVRFAEEAGFDVVWFPEHHLSSYLVCPQPLTAVAWAAQHTSRIRLGTGVIVLPYYHPLSLAEEIGMVDALSGGRLDLGIGRGGYIYERVRYQVTDVEASERERECFDAVLAVWGDQDASFEGKHWRFPPTAAMPKPVQRPHPPVWVATRSPDTLRWALRHSFNLMAAPQREPFSRVEAYFEQLRRFEQEEPPRVPPKVAVSRMTFVSRDHEEALRTMELVWKSHCINRHLHNGTARVWQGRVEPDPLPESETIAPGTLLENIVAGDPETCVRKLRQYEAIGVDLYCVWADLGFEQGRVMRSLRLFVDEVMPHFRVPGPESRVSGRDRGVEAGTVGMGSQARIR